MPAQLRTYLATLLGLAAAYYVTGRLGLLLAIPPGYATAVWPPAGIALAGVLLFGYRAWPGVALGSFLVNAGTSFDGATAAALLRSLGLAAVIGFGAAFQACAGAFLVRRFVGFPTAMDDAGDVLKSLLFGGPLGCLVNATWSVTALAVSGTVVWSEYASNWWTWWVGDTIGIVTVAPLAFIAAAPPREIWRARFLPVGLPLLAAIAVAVTGFAKSSAWERERIQFDFERRAAAIADTLQKSLDGYLEVVYSIGSFYAGTTEVDRQGFHAFASRPLARHPGIKALEWIPRVPASLRAAFEEAARADRHPAFGFTERDAAGRSVAAGSRDEYFPVYFVEPYRGNEVALGFDLASDPDRRAALLRARDSGDVVATNRITLVQETAKSSSILVFLPVYNGGAAPQAVESRRRSLRGFALLVLRMDDFVRGSLPDREWRDLDVRLYDDTGPPGEDLLWSSGGSLAGAPQRAGGAPPSRTDGLSWRTSFGVGTRRWSVRVLPGPGYLALHRSWESWTVLAIALVFAGLLGALLLIVTGRALRIERANAERRRMQEALQKSEAGFRVTFASNPLSMWVYDLATLRFLEVNDAAVAQYGYSRDEFLAMRITDIRPPEDVPRLLDEVARPRLALQSSQQWRHRRKDGRIIIVKIVSHTLDFADRKAVLVVAQDITDQVAAEEETRRRTAELEAFYEVSRRLRETQTLGEMYPILVESAMRLLRADHGALVFFDADRRVLTRLYASGALRDAAEATFLLDGSPYERVEETGRPYVATDFADEVRPSWLQAPAYQGLGPVAIVPVRSEQAIIGGLKLGRSRLPAGRPFTDEEVRLLEGIAEIGGTAIRRARLRHDLEQSYIALVLALARASDARDSYTADHSERIADSAAALARTLGCGEPDVQNVYWGALLHDIGKLGIPDNILRKPGPLTDGEWHVMRRHPLIGEEILRPVERMREVASLVRHHQERWDGTGYPDRLRGEEIPSGARIIAVADAYGAMTDDRPYGKRRSFDEAIGELRAGAGTQFDPRVIDVFCGMLAAGKAPGVPKTRAVEPNAAGQPSAAVIARSLSHARQLARLVPAMTDVAKRLLHPLDLSAVLDAILNQIHEVFGYSICSVFFIDEAAQELYMRAQRGYDPEVARTMRLRVGAEGIVGWVASQGKPYYAADVTQDPRYVSGSAGARSNVAYPLVVDDRILGVLSVESPDVDGFPAEIREFLEAFAFLAALAILRAQRDESLSQMALTDPLTGLGNRRALWDALEREVARASRDGHAVSVVVVEVDCFKQVNDRFGHLHGDLILKTVADVLKRTSRTMDFVARFGGDEFVVLLPGVSKQTAVQIAERMRHHVEEVLVPGGPRLTVSVGLAGLPEDGDTAEPLVDAADRAMYQAKHGGGNRVDVA